MTNSSTDCHMLSLSADNFDSRYGGRFTGGTIVIGRKLECDSGIDLGILVGRELPYM